MSSGMSENRCASGLPWRRGNGANAHPTYGVIPPAYFLPEGHHPYFCDLSEFVIERALQNWHYLLEPQSLVDLSINLPAP
ncbi:hypothetical protein ABH995_000781 [Bradyrhizobium yuanmingense]|uniref:hypothetical protein n=1 Tax=Bradyrhizobium yuanmingense TaxID=108015 RepID=UPI0035179F6E